jgi:tRNA threonylcarbamoyladenosine biosynthesis protein TsaB
VVPVSTLAALACSWPEAVPAGAEILAAIDARMGEVYLGRFGHDGQGRISAIGDEWMAAPALPSIPGAASLVGVGTGFSAVDSALVASLGVRLLGHDAAALPHAADVARLAAYAFAQGGAIAADALEPAYLRDKVAMTLAEQRAARGG